MLRAQQHRLRYANGRMQKKRIGKLRRAYNSAQQHDGNDVTQLDEYVQALK